jgi:hypothetical protein
MAVAHHADRESLTLRTPQGVACRSAEEYPSEEAGPGQGRWETYWLQVPVAALGDLTPRRAAGGTHDQRMRLEGLLRQFEYEADLLAAEGKTGIDTGWLREELDMKDKFPAWR